MFHRIHSRLFNALCPRRARAEKGILLSGIEPSTLILEPTQGNLMVALDCLCIMRTKTLAKAPSEQ